MKAIRTAADVTADHIEDAAAMRAGEYGGEPLSWEDVIDKLEQADEDWGTSMTSDAIKYLQREVRAALRSA